MQRARQKTEPSAAPADAASRWADRLGRWWAIVALGGLTVPLLTLCFAPWGLWPLAYVALAPLAVAAAIAPRGRTVLLMAAAVGLVYWLVNLYWLTWVTPLGYGAGCVYLCLFWLAAAAALRPMLRRGWPGWLVVPLVWVALEYLRAFGVGFPWNYLAHSQYARTPLIQIADLTGQYGLSFAVGMVNGLVVDIVLGRLGPAWLVAGRRRLVIGGSACVVVFAGLLGYGYFRLGQATQSPGPRVGIVQRAIPTSLAGPNKTLEEMLEEHLIASTVFVGRDCDLLMWPETILPISMNPEILEADVAGMDTDRLAGLVHALRWVFLQDPAIPESQRRKELAAYIAYLRKWAAMIERISKGLDCPVLAGGSTLHYQGDPYNEWVLRNSALWFDRSWRAEPIYSKMHPVPFSEYVPMKYTYRPVYRFLRTFVPEQMAQVDPGRQWTRFELVTPDGPVGLAAPICYEGTFARLCRHMVMDDGRKVVGILANMSNDGWFVTPPPGPQTLSAEHAQHLASYCFRAVENRVAVLRAVNTGISASIDSNGRIVAMLAGRTGMGTGSAMQTGRLWLTDAPADQTDGLTVGPRVLVDSRVSVYSQVGDVFAVGVLVVALAGAARTCLRRRTGLEDKP